MSTSNIKISMYNVLGKIFSIIGYTLASFMVLGLLIDIFDGKASSSSVSTNIIMYILMFSLSGFLIYKGYTIKRINKRFRQYTKIISYNGITLLEGISASTHQSIDFVKKDLEKMIDKKYFKNAYIDMKLGEIIIIRDSVNQPINSDIPETKVEREQIQCKNCGAINSIIRDTFAGCEYCGSKLNKH